MKDTPHFNQLTPQEAETVAILMEECAEVIQVCGKILRHGLESSHPDNPTVTNRQLLELEIGHVLYAKNRSLEILPLSSLEIVKSINKKAEKIGRFLHHP